MEIFGKRLTFDGPTTKRLTALREDIQQRQAAGDFSDSSPLSAEEIRRALFERWRLTITNNGENAQRQIPAGEDERTLGLGPLQLANPTETSFRLELLDNVNGLRVHLYNKLEAKRANRFRLPTTATLVEPESEVMGSVTNTVPYGILRANYSPQERDHVSIRMYYMSSLQDPQTTTEATLLPSSFEITVREKGHDSPVAHFTQDTFKPEHLPYLASLAHVIEGFENQQ